MKNMRNSRRFGVPSSLLDGDVVGASVLRRKENCQSLIVSLAWTFSRCSAFEFRLPTLDYSNSDSERNSIENRLSRGCIGKEGGGSRWDSVL